MVGTWWFLRECGGYATRSRDPLDLIHHGHPSKNREQNISHRVIFPLSRFIYAYELSEEIAATLKPRCSDKYLRSALTQYATPHRTNPTDLGIWLRGQAALNWKVGYMCQARL